MTEMFSKITRDDVFLWYDKVAKRGNENARDWIDAHTKEYQEWVKNSINNKQTFIN